MDGTSLASSSPVGSGSRSGLSAAERFEDEKRRIIDSCFNKKDTDGTLLESYITHIRIVEDAAFPSSPPPPSSNPEAKKPRLIIVAVRKSGRVRMHKARENLNGTFSIGKTWPLDDLSAVESFSGAVPTNPEEEQRKQWAGVVGFTVTIGKPYYWQANSQKEKQFFIASLVKIYSKYTGGKFPELNGFDDRERGPLLGNAPQSRPGTAKSQQPLQLPASSPTPTTPNQGSARTRRRSPSREPAVLRPPFQESIPPQQQQPSSVSVMNNESRPQSSRTQIASRGEESANRGLESNTLAPLQSQSSLGRGIASNNSQDFESRDDGSNLRPRSKGGPNNVLSTAGRLEERNATPPSLRIRTPDGNNLTGRDAVHNGVSSNPAPLAILPERRKHPVQTPSDLMQSYASEADANLIPAPLASPLIRRDDVKVPVRSSERPLSPNAERPATAHMEFTQTPRSVDALTNPPLSQQTQETPEPLQINKKEQVSETPQAASPVTSPHSPMVDTPVESRAQLPPEPLTDHRPGLGPMIKKKSRADIANTFRKAATAASTFKPRAGGAAERLLQQEEKVPDGPDGITGVVPAPSLVRGISNNSKKGALVQAPLSANDTTSSSSISTDAKPVAISPTKSNSELPEVKITLPHSQLPDQGKMDSNVVSQDVTDPEKTKAREVRRQKPASERTQTEFASLGLDPSILDGKGTEFIALLDEFGWVEEGVYTKNIESMKDEFEREINKAQAGGWLNRLEEEDDRISSIKEGIDKCIAECDEMDGLLTLYGVELGTLTEDVAYIEAQSQGLQVQAANQKLLQAELQSLLDTITISPKQLQSLREASLAEFNGLIQIESSLVVLFKAMVTIDPTLSLSASGYNNDSSVRSVRGGIGDSEIGSMRVLQEKKEIYKSESTHFLYRLKAFLQIHFAMAVDETKKALESESSNLGRRSGKAKLDYRNHDLARTQLWRYSSLMLFAREVNSAEWEDLMRTYENIYKPVYQNGFRDGVFAWKRSARKSLPDDNENLFTSHVEKQAEGIATTARKLTVKRSQTLAKKTFNRGETGSNKTNSDKLQDGRIYPYEVFGGVLEEMSTIICMEQNFIVEFFHLSSLEVQDFPECVAVAPPGERRVSDLRRPRPLDPNRDMAKRVVQSMGDLFAFFGPDLLSLMKWVVEQDSIQGVGVLAILERKLQELEETNQEFLTRALSKVHNQLKGLFNNFLNEQIRAIEDTKVKIKKRKGVISFVKIFPAFSSTLETMLVSTEDLDIRTTVNDAYGRINKCMFESLKVIARDVPSAASLGVSMGDPEDKEALNYQILLIENMNHYLEEVDARNNPVLEEWKQKAANELNEHLSLYVSAVVRRPLGRLLDKLESTESLITSGVAPSEVSGKASHGRQAFHERLTAFDSKTIMKGIQELKGRVEKHFMKDDHDLTANRALASKVLDACERYYEKVEERIRAISADVYQGDAAIQWSHSDVMSAFRR